jgi:hypothetical protein
MRSELQRFSSLTYSSAKCVIKVAGLLAISARIETCFHGSSITAHAAKAQRELFAVRYDATTGLNTFLNKLDSKSLSLNLC